MQKTKSRAKFMLIVSILLSLLTTEMVLWRLIYAKNVVMTMSNTFLLAIEYVAVIVLTISIGSVAFENFETNYSGYKFAAYLFSIIRALFYDFVVWMADGINTTFAVAINYIFNSFYCLAILSMLISFANYIMTTLPSASKFMNKYLASLKVAHYLLTLMLFLNFEMNFIFSIQDGVFVRKPMANFLFAIVGLLMLMLVCLFFNKKIDQSTKIALFAFIVLPLLGTFLQIVLNGKVFFPLGLFISACLMFVYAHNRQNSLLKEQQLEIEKQKSSIMLSQIQPHFLYNTLTAIAFLCRNDPQNAEKLTNRFSNYLRSNIIFLSSDDKIDFKKELENVLNYVEIEKYRFEDRVNVDIKIGKNDFKIPMLTVQPMVENAIRHGICKKDDGGTVWISSYDDTYNNYVEIKDDGVGFDSKNYKADGKIHIGIENVRKRIESIGGEVLIDSKINIGTTVIIRIPKEEL